MYPYTPQNKDQAQAEFAAVCDWFRNNEGKQYNCTKCNELSSEANHPQFAQRYGKVCLWCADTSIDTTRHAGMTRMADAEMGDL